MCSDLDLAAEELRRDLFAEHVLAGSHEVERSGGEIARLKVDEVVFLLDTESEGR